MGEAVKQEDYVALGRCAVDRLRSEIDNLNGYIYNLNDVSGFRSTVTKPLTWLAGR